GLALGVDAEDDRDDAAEDHRPGSDHVADEEAGPVGSVADEVPVPVRAERPEALGDGEEKSRWTAHGPRSGRPRSRSGSQRWPPRRRRRTRRPSRWSGWSRSVPPA